MKPLENMIVLDFSQYLAGPPQPSGLPIWGPVSSKLNDRGAETAPDR